MMNRIKNSFFWYFGPLAAALAVFGWSSHLNTLLTYPKETEPTRVIQSEADTYIQKLISIKCELLDHRLYLSILTDNDGLITGFRVDGDPTIQGSFSLAQLEQGVDINAPRGTIAAPFNPLAHLKATDFHPARGGVIRLSYIKNALSKFNNDMGQFEFIVSNYRGRWIAQNVDSRRAFTLAELVPSYVHVPFIGDRSYGIKTIQVR
jgi:hypothetical protein